MKILKNLLTVSLLTFTTNTVYCFFGTEQKQKIVMINPAGDARRTGRRLSNSYERAITYKIAEQLGKELKNRYQMDVIITRTPGTEILPLQNASFANRKSIDFFIDIHVYKEENEKPKIYLMHRMLDPLKDIARHSHPVLELTRLDDAHTRNIHQTKSFSERIDMVMSQPEYQKFFDFVDLHGLPIKPLEGIIAPAVLFDIGLNDEEKWPTLIDPLATSLKFLLDY